MTALVTLAGTALYGTDAAGAEWKVLAMEGWDSPPVRLDLADRPSQHGAYAPDPFYGPRRVVVEGRVQAPSESARREAIARLGALTGALDGVTLTVAESPFSRQVTVWRAGELTVAQRDGGYARWSLPLVAADPRRYDTSETATSVGLPSTSSFGFGLPLGFPFGFGGAGAGGDVNVSNAGDLAVFPTLTITGPVLNPVVRNNTIGDELRFAIDLLAGQSLVIDTSERTVLLDGTANRRNTLLSGSTWPTVEPGINSYQFRGSSSGAALLGISYRSGWA